MIIGIDANADPAFRKLTELKKALTDLRTQFNKDLKVPSKGGLDAAAFKKQYGIAKSEHQKFLANLDQLDKSYNNKQQNMRTKALVEATRRANDQAAKELAKANASTSSSIGGLAGVQAKLNSAFGLGEANIVRLRYALYDVGSAAQQTSQIFNALNQATISAAIEYETAFSAVERASQLDINTDSGRQQLGQLRDDLLRLSEELPNSFQDISGIAALGSALGIANEDLTEFSETVIQFSTASNVGIEASAQAFGTLGELLDVSADKYNNLGSAIAFVGVNSNATESQVISVAEAIAGVASSAGLSADFTVGLAGALASLKVPAEQSRGALTRVFAEVNRATASGGPVLNNFANLLGVTTDQARELATTDMGGFFTQFVQSLSGLNSEDITFVLDSLNLADIRVTNTLVRLAGNFDTTTESLRMASEAYADGTYLAEAYGVKADDIAVRLQKLVNTVNNLLASFGAALFPVIGPVLDFLQGVVNFFEQLTKNPVGQFVAGTAAAFALLATAVFGLLGAVIPITAGFLAFRTAVGELASTSSGFTLALARMGQGFMGVGAAANGAKMSMLGFAGAAGNSQRINAMLNGTLGQQTAAMSVLAARQALTVASGQGFNAQLAARAALLRANAGAIWANVAAMSAMQKAMALMGWIGIAASAIGLLSAAFDAFTQQQASQFEKNKQAAEDYFGTVNGLAEAFRQDATEGGATIDIAFDEGSVNKFNEVIDKSRELGDTQEESNARAVAAIREAAGATDEFTVAQGGAEAAVNKLTDAIVVGYDTAAKKALADLLIQSQDFKDLISSGALEAIGGTPVGFAQAILGDPQNGGRNYVDSLINGIKIELQGRAVELSEIDISQYVGNSASAQNQALFITQLAAAYDISIDTARELANSLVSVDTAQTALNGVLQQSAIDAEAARVGQEALAGSLGQLEADALAAEKSMQEYKNQLESVKSANDSLDDLSQSISENGTAFAGALGQSANYTQGAISNSVALADTLKAVIQAAAATGLNAAQASAAGVAQVFAQMVANGVEASNALNAISSAGFGGFTGALKTAISGQYPGLTNAFNSIKTSANKATGAVGGTAAKVRTLIDYANDLKNVFQRAFDIRFSGQQALDKIASSWSDIAEAAQDAREEIRGIDVDIQRLTADKALQEYFLQVAEAFGDSVKAADVRANLAEIEGKLVEENRKLAAAQGKTNKTLRGNSKEAIANRAEILGLVGEYQDYIYSLAASGASQQELAARTAQLRNDFIAQATQLGYNSDELGSYAAAFDDVSTAISRVPRNITVAANTNPALQALNELNARANAATAARTMQVGASVDFSALQKFSRGVNLLNSLTAAQATQQEYLRQRNYTAARIIGFNISSLNSILNSGNFASGGYVSGPGSATSDSIPANLSNGEYVVRAAAVGKYGVGFFDSLNQMRTPQYYSGGEVGRSSGVTMVSLSPEDRAILRNMGGSGDVVLYANNEAIARSANEGNRNIVAQGGRP